jgi:hypothetical protein
MRIGPFRLTRQRAVRAVAGLVAGFVFAGNVLAAAGLCAIKAPDGNADWHRTASQAAATSADAHPCEQHRADERGSGPTTSSHHCPTDDPSAQTRTVDVPAAQLMAAIAVAGFGAFGVVPEPVPVASSTHLSNSQPLYARLQRLRL